MSIGNIDRRLVEVLQTQPCGHQLPEPVNPRIVMTAAMCVGRWGGDGAFLDELFVYPTPAGGVQLEWDHHDTSIEAEFFIQDDAVRVHLLIGQAFSASLTLGDATHLLLSSLGAS
ncbi:MAG: hypothetical protein AAFV53_00345 [Myxococcota bacterium]